MGTIVLGYCMGIKAYNWIVSFFGDHSHCTKFQGTTSPFVSVNASVIQGSALGPAAYLINAADLNPVNKDNLMVKFADDVCLIVGSSNEHTRVEELLNVETWAENNNLKLNSAKSVEIVFENHSKRKCSTMPPPVPNIVRHDSHKWLGVIISRTFRMREHIDSVLASCQKTLFALKTLRAHGMSTESLHRVYEAVALGKIRYASSAWFGFTSSDDRDRIDTFLRKSTRFGFLPQDHPTFSALCERADLRLFNSILSEPNHVLRPLLPPVVSRTYNLRRRAHNFALPERTSALSDKNFFIRMLYTT